MHDEEKLYPIGKGWSWDIPFVSFEEGKQYVHLQGGGAYEVAGIELVGYEWKGLTFKADTTQTVNNEKSAYALTSIQGTWKQYFTSDGRLIRIADSYNNTIDFSYTHNAQYGRKLLTKISNNLGNVITISYSTNKVTINYNGANIVYQKTTNDGMEILSSVTDQAGRTTGYSYSIKPAKFNLVASKPERALANPYVLLTEVLHPTGAATEYVYEGTPVDRFIGNSAKNEYYRLKTRQDKLYYSNNTSKIFNQYHITYGSNDVGKTYNTSYEVVATITASNKQSKYTYSKNFIHDTVGNKIYLTKEQEIVNNKERITAYQYNKKVGVKAYTVSTPTGVTYSNTFNSDVLTKYSTYDDYGNILTSTDEKGQTTQYTYDTTKFLLKSVLAPSGTNEKIYTEYTYNTQGSVTSEISKKANADGSLIHSITYSNFDTFGNPRLITTTNHTHTFNQTVTYDTTKPAYPSAISYQVTNANGTKRSVTLKYDYNKALGKIAKYTDGLGYVSNYSYDALGRLILVTQADGSKVSALYEDLQNKVTVTDEVGNKTVTIWNGFGWEKEKGRMIGTSAQALTYQKLASTEYNAHGLIESQYDAANNITISYEYDGWGRVTKSNDSTGVKQLTTYDDVNRIQTVKTQSSNQLVHDGISYSYDKYNRLIQTKEHDYMNNQTAIIENLSYHPTLDLISVQYDANQNVTKFSYDWLGQLINVEDAKGNRTQYSYDGSGNLIKTTYPDLSTSSKTNDELGNILKSIDQAGKAHTYVYDANGNLSSQTDRKGQQFTYSYNNRNMLTKKQGPYRIDYVYLLDEW